MPDPFPLPPWTPEYRQLAHNRAVEKARVSLDEPAIQRDQAYLVQAIIGVASALPWPVLGMTSKLPAGVAAAASGVALLTAAVNLALFFLKRPVSPSETVRLWLDACSRRKFERALSFVMLADRDGFPRLTPQGQALNHPGSYGQYWEDLLAQAGLPRARIQVVQAQEHRLNDRFCVVTGIAAIGGLHFNPLTAFAVITLCLATIIGVAVALPPEWGKYAVLALPVLGVGGTIALLRRSRHGCRASFRKVVVRAGVEWRIFNGEWAGPEDMDTSWVEAV